MKIRFGKNDVLDTYAATQGMQNQITSLQDQLPMGGTPSVEKLLLFTLLEQATAMSSEENQAKLEAMTGRSRLDLMADIEAHIGMFGE